MSERTLKRIFGALGVLLVLWLGSVLLSGRGGGGSGSDGGVGALLERMDESTVSAIHVAGRDRDISLERSGDAWTVNGYVADSSAVARLWNALAGAEVGGVVATNPANHQRMGVSADSALTVDFTLTDGGTARLLVGNPGQITPSAFARLPDQDAVVVVAGDLRPTLIQGLTDWRNKTILRVDTAAVTRVVLESAAGTHVVERSDSTWLVDGGPANATTMRAVLEELTRFVAVGFVEDREPSEEDPRRVIALGAGMDTLGVVLITSENRSRQARTPGSDIVFEVAAFRADRISPDIERLTATEPGGA